VYANAQHPLDMFPCSFSVDGKVGNLLRTCHRHGKLSRHVKMSLKSPQQVVIMEFRKRHDTTDNLH